MGRVDAFPRRSSSPRRRRGPRCSEHPRQDLPASRAPRVAPPRGSTRPPRPNAHRGRRRGVRRRSSGMAAPRGTRHRTLAASSERSPTWSPTCRVLRVPALTSAMATSRAPALCSSCARGAIDLGGLLVLRASPVARPDGPAAPGGPRRRRPGRILDRVPTGLPARLSTARLPHTPITCAHVMDLAVTLRMTVE